MSEDPIEMNHKLLQSQSYRMNKIRAYLFSKYKALNSGYRFEARV
jgi:hypothetical protein